MSCYRQQCSDAHEFSPKGAFASAQAEQIDVLSSHVAEENIEVAGLIPQERCLVPQIQEHRFEAITVIPQGRVSVRIVEQTLDLQVPQIMEEIVAVARLVGPSCAAGRENTVTFARSAPRSRLLM